VSERDKARWDRKWAEVEGPYRPHPLLRSQGSYLTGGLALDLACGQGQNAIWLAQRGYHVLAVDISLVALQAAQEAAYEGGLADNIDFAAVDLDRWPVPPASFDLIVVFRFLDRRLFGSIRDGVRPGGLVYYSTRHLGTLATRPEANVTYLLQPGELKDAFTGWRILYYEEGPEDAHIVARKQVYRRSSAGPRRRPDQSGGWATTPANSSSMTSDSRPKIG